MTPAAAAAILPAKGSALHIFGMSVSWDALLIAGASLVGILFLYKLGQPGGTFTPSSTVDPGGGGADGSLSSTVPAPPPGPPLPPGPAFDPGPSTTGPGGGGALAPTPPNQPAPSAPMPQSRPQGTVGGGGGSTPPASSTGTGAGASTALSIAGSALSGGGAVSLALSGIGGSIPTGPAPLSTAPPPPSPYLQGHGAIA